MSLSVVFHGTWTFLWRITRQIKVSFIMFVYEREDLVDRLLVSGCKNEEPTWHGPLVQLEGPASSLISVGWTAPLASLLSWAYDPRPVERCWLDHLTSPHQCFYYDSTLIFRRKWCVMKNRTITFISIFLILLVYLNPYLIASFFLSLVFSSWTCSKLSVGSLHFHFSKSKTKRESLLV